MATFMRRVRAADLRGCCGSWRASSSSGTGCRRYSAFPGEMPPHAGLHHLDRRADRADRRHPGDDRALHALGGLPVQRADGLRVLDGPRPACAAPDDQPGRAGGALLLRLPVHRGAGPGHLERRRREATERWRGRSGPSSQARIVGAVGVEVGRRPARGRVGDAASFIGLPATASRPIAGSAMPTTMWRAPPAACARRRPPS